MVRWPGKVPAGRVSNELVHQVDFFTTLVKAGGGTVPGDRQIDGMDMTDFLLGDAEESGRDIVLCLQGNRLQAAKWHQWKVHLFKQDDFYSTWTPYNFPIFHNLEWDPREEHQVDFPHGWVLHPIAAAAGAFLKTLVAEPPIKPGTPDPYVPPKPGELQPADAPADRPDHAVHHHAGQVPRRASRPRPRDRAPIRMSASPAGTELCVLLACFAGPKRRRKIRGAIGKRIEQAAATRSWIR